MADKNSSAPKKDVLASWTEPIRLRPLKWAYKRFNPQYSASAGLIAMVTLEVLAMIVIGLGGGTLTQEVVTMLTLAALPIALLVSLLPGLLAPAEITILKDRIIRECRGRQDAWRYDELTDVTTRPTSWRGETRYLLLFKDRRGEEQSILLPWKMDRSKVLQMVSRGEPDPKRIATEAEDSNGLEHRVR